MANYITKSGSVRLMGVRRSKQLTGWQSPNSRLLEYLSTQLLLMLKIIVFGLVLAAIILSDAVSVASAETVPSPLQQVRENLPGDEIICGPQTMAVNGTCVPDYETICGPGATVVDEKCVGSELPPGEKPSEDCLIATASYGSEMAPQVQMLREVRDNILLSTYSGVLFMDGFNSVYYSFSPQVAQLENENPIFREAVRAFITPLISTLSVMTLASEGSESEVIFFGVSAIGLIVGTYIAAPVIAVWQARKRI